MKSSTTPSFWKTYQTLQPEIKAKARKTYRLWLRNPRHPSLRFGPKGNYWSIRVTSGWRALAREHNGVLYWFWIGPHDDYERLLKR